MRFKVYGKPVGKQRPRFNSLTKTTFTPGKTKSYEREIATACYAHMFEHRIKR